MAIIFPEGTNKDSQNFFVSRPRAFRDTKRTWRLA